MIQINLLEQNATRRKPGARAAAAPSSGGMGGGSAAGSTLIMLAALLMLGLNGSIGWMVYQSWDASYQKYDTARVKRDKLKAEIAKKQNDSDRIREYREVLNNQMDVLKTLDPPDRILWSEKFNMLANLVPANVFLSKIEIQENVVMVETQGSIAAREKWEKGDQKLRGAQPEKVMKPVISYGVKITGLGLGKDNVEQLNNALNFQRAMTEYKQTDPLGKSRRFMDGFNSNIDFESVEATAYEGEAVNKFIFKLTTVPVGGSPEDTKARDAAVKGKTQVASAETPDTRKRANATE